MLDYFTNALVTSTIWGLMSLSSSAMGFHIAEGAAFLKSLFYGLSALPFFLMFKKEINKDVVYMVKNQPKLLTMAIMLFFMGGGAAQYFYYKAINLSNKKAHIVVTVTHTLPVVFAVLGSYFLLGEEINKETFVGITFVIVGVFIMKMFGKKKDINKN